MRHSFFGAPLLRITGRYWETRGERPEEGRRPDGPGRSVNGGPHKGGGAVPSDVPRVLYPTF
jgi:hypothetical protein